MASSLGTCLGLGRPLAPFGSPADSLPSRLSKSYLLRAQPSLHRNPLYLIVTLARKPVRTCRKAVDIPRPRSQKLRQRVDQTPEHLAFVAQRPASPGHGLSTGANRRIDPTHRTRVALFVYHTASFVVGRSCRPRSWFPRSSAIEHREPRSAKSTRRGGLREWSPRGFPARATAIHAAHRSRHLRSPTEVDRQGSSSISSRLHLSPGQCMGQVHITRLTIYAYEQLPAPPHDAHVLFAGEG